MNVGLKSLLLHCSWELCVLVHQLLLWLLWLLPLQRVTWGSRLAGWNANTTIDSNGHCWFCYCATHLKWVQLSGCQSGLCQLWMGPPQVSLSCSELSIPLIFLCWWLLWCFVSNFRFWSGYRLCQWAWLFLYSPLQPISCISMSGSCAPWCWFVAHAWLHKVLVLQLLWSGGALCQSKQLFCSHSVNIVGHTALGK